VVQSISLSILAECTYSNRAVFLRAVFLTELYGGLDAARTLDLPTASTPSIVRLQHGMALRVGSCLTG